MNKSVSIDLAQKTFDPTIIGEWKGLLENEEMFLELYMKKKYGKYLHYLPFTGLILNYNNKKKEYRDDFDTKFCVYWDNKIYDYKKGNDVFNNYFDLYRNTEKRFTLYSCIQAIQVNGNKSFHSIFFIYDRLLNEIELFNNISNKTYDIGIKQNKRSMTFFFKEIYGNSVKIDLSSNNIDIFINDKRSSIDVVDIMAVNCDIKDYSFTAEGWCLVWTMWYLEFRIRNRDIPRKEALQKAFIIFALGNQRICEHIRGYAHFIQDTVKDYKILIIDDKKVRVTMKSIKTLSIKEKLVLEKSKQKNNYLYRKLTPLISVLSMMTLIYYKINKKLKS